MYKQCHYSLRKRIFTSEATSSNTVVTLKLKNGTLKRMQLSYSNMPKWPVREKRLRFSAYGGMQEGLHYQCCPLNGFQASGKAGDNIRPSASKRDEGKE